MIVFDKRSPVYEQIIAYFKAEIVNPNTVQRAFRELEVMGLITTGNNVMSRVTEDVERIEQLKEEMLDEAIASFAVAIKPLNLSAEDVIEHLKKQL